MSECTYLDFIYADGTLYGGCTYLLSNVEVISKDTIKITVDNLLVVNDAYGNVDNYTVRQASDPSVVLNVRKVLVPQDGTLQTTEVFLAIDKMLPDVEYEVSISPAVTSVLGFIAANSFSWVGRRTKVDDQLTSFPKHYSMQPGSAVRALLQAFALEDDRIGGDLK